MPITLISYFSYRLEMDFFGFDLEADSAVSLSNTSSRVVGDGVREFRFLVSFLRCKRIRINQTMLTRLSMLVPKT